MPGTSTRYGCTASTAHRMEVNERYCPENRSTTSNASVPDKITWVTSSVVPLLACSRNASSKFFVERSIVS